MKITKEQLRKIENFAIKKYEANKDPFHNLDHALMTAKIASHIAVREGANPLVCKIASLLHDISPKTRGKPHGLKSAKLAREFLKKIKLDKKITDQIYLAIAYHDTSRYKKAKTLEGKIIFEADKLQCFGPLGFVREYGDLLIKGVIPEKALKKSLECLKNYNPSFPTKTGRKLKNKLLRLNRLFLEIFNKQRR